MSSDGWYVEFARRLREARVARGMSQDEVAKALGMKRASVTAIENGMQKVWGHQAAQLSTIFGFQLPDNFPVRYELRRVDGLQ